MSTSNDIVTEHHQDGQGNANDFPQDVANYLLLREVRAELPKVRLERRGKPGIYNDNSPTGCGKSTADNEEIRNATASLTVLPTHENCRQRKDELENAGITDVAIHPELNAQTCQRFDEAKPIQSSGLSVFNSLCLKGCPHLDGCAYLTQRKQASESPHAICTHERFARQAESLVKQGAYVAVHEDSSQLLRPKFTLCESGLKELAGVALTAATASARRRRKDPLLPELLGTLYKLANAWLAELQRAEEHCELSPRPNTPNILPDDWDYSIRNALPRGGLSPQAAEALRAAVAWLCGELESVDLQVDAINIEGGAIRMVKRFTCSMRTSLPARASYWFCDATGSRERLEELTGLPVEDVTPVAATMIRVPAVQIPLDIKRSTSVSVVKARLRGVMLQNAWAESVGVIGHSMHVREMFGKGENAIEPEFRERIAKWTYFGSGDERASNDWHKACKLLVILGTPRVGPEEIRSELLRIGKRDAARQSGGWNERLEVGRSKEGLAVPIRPLAYTHPDWQKAHETLVVTRLKQAIGRGRSILHEGIKVIVCSSEPLGLTLIHPKDSKSLNGQNFAAVEAVRQLVAQTGNGVSTSQIAKLLGRSERTVRWQLTEAEEAGLLFRVAKRWAPAKPLG